MIRHGAKKTGPRLTKHVLDAGCGTGANLRLLSSLYPEAILTGVDLSPTALELVPHVANLRLLQGDVNRLDLPDSSQDLVLSADVLCHKDAIPAQALSQFCRVLRPGGHLFLNLPAHAWLEGEHGEAVQNVRRFTRSDARKLLESNAFSMVLCRHWNCALLPVLWLRRGVSRVAQNRRGEARSDLAASDGLATPPLALWMELETRVASALPLPFGSSLFIVARKSLHNNTLKNKP